MDFDANFPDGYTFRHVVEYLKSTNVDGIFNFSKNAITYERESNTNTVFNILHIRTCDINYSFGHEDDELVSIGLSLSDFLKNTKVGKKDGFRMFRECGEIDISCQHMCADAQSSGSDRSFLVPKQISYDEEFFVDIELPENSPNHTGTVGEFSKVCSKMMTFQPQYVLMTAYPRGIKLVAYNSSNKRVKQNFFGSVSDDNDEGMHSITIKQSLLKAFSKIKNISPSTGMIKFYAEPDKPTIKIILSVGCYGKLTIFLRNPPEEDEEE